MVWYLPLNVTCGCAHSACMTCACSSDRRPRLWKFSFRPVNSTGFQPTPMPSRNRPPDSTSRQAACFATNAVCRCATISTPVENVSLVVAAARYPSSTNGSWNMPSRCHGGSRCIAAGIAAQHVIGRFQEVIAQGFKVLSEVADRWLDRRRCRRMERARQVAWFRTPYFASASRTALIFSGATAIGGMPARSCCSKDATRESRCAPAAVQRLGQLHQRHVGQAASAPAPRAPVGRPSETSLCSRRRAKSAGS